MPSSKNWSRAYGKAVWIWLRLGATSGAAIVAFRLFLRSHLAELPKNVDRTAAQSHILDNEFIQAGYRPQLTLRQSLLSILSFHNETFNIYSHAFAAIFSAYIAVRRVQRYRRHARGMGNSEFDQSLFLVIPLIADTVVFSVSAVAHTFASHSSAACRKLFALDRACISITYASHVFTAGMLAFSQPQDSGKRLALQLASGFAASLAPVVQLWELPKVFNVLVPGLVGLLASFPIATGWLRAHRGGHHEFRTRMSWYVILGFGPGLLGGILYLTQFPEKWLSKYPQWQTWVDTVLHGHALMHVWTLLSTWIGYLGLKMWSRHLSSLQISS
jgi:predicted membrane channel-forming protein YqfA (hemolysin III family)